MDTPREMIELLIFMRGGVKSTCKSISSYCRVIGNYCRANMQTASAVAGKPLPRGELPGCHAIVISGLYHLAQFSLCQL
jgi:hypothetical protein